MNIKKITSFIFLGLLLSSCSVDEYPDLKDFINNARSKPSGKIDKLPSFSGYESFTYAASGMRSPFQLRLASKIEDSSSSSTVFPDFERVKEPLEAFALNELTLVGTMTKSDGELWGLIEHAGGSVYAIKQGQYIGKNFGQVTAINAQKMSVLEIVPDGPGRWIERPQTMILKGKNNE